MNGKRLRVGPIDTNCYILEDEKSRQAVVVDPGGDAPEIIRNLEEAELRYILLTHGHYDHTGGVAELVEAFPQAKVYIHEKDVRGVDTNIFPLGAQVSDLNFYGEGDAIAFGEARLRVLHTPGHSEGSVTLRCGNLLLCGDTLFAGTCGRTDFPGGSMEKMMASLRRLGKMDGDLRICPGHMEMSTLAAERARNPYVRQALGIAP